MSPSKSSSPTQITPKPVNFWVIIMLILIYPFSSVGRIITTFCAPRAPLTSVWPILRGSTVAKVIPSPRSKPKSSPTALESLPIEIVLEVITPTLGTSCLLNLLRVSRYIHFISAPILYPIIYKSIDITLSDRKNPLFVDGAILNPLPPSRPHQILLGQSTDRSGIRTELRRTVYRNLLPNRFAHTVHLTLTQHNRSVCARATPLSMPNPLTLRIRPNTIDDHLNLCISSPFVTMCPLITQLRPRQLILGGCSTGVTGLGKGLRSSSAVPFPPRTVKHIVILAGMLSGFERNLISGPTLLHQLGSTVEKVSFVMSCAEDGWEKMWKRRDPRIDDAITMLADCEHFAESIMRAAVGEAKIIEIVGSEITERFFGAAEPMGVDFKGTMRSILSTQLEAKGVLATTARSRAEAVAFVDEETFAQQQGWYGRVKTESKEPLVAKLLEMARVAAEARAARAAELAYEAREAEALDAAEELARVTEDERDNCGSCQEYGNCCWKHGWGDYGNQEYYADDYHSDAYHSDP